MITIKKENWPLWIKRKLKGRKNVEVKYRNGRYYLYEYKNVYDREKKRARKKSWYISVLRKEEYVVEHGNTFFLYDLCKDIINKIKDTFKEYWREIVIFTFNRVIYPSPIKRIPSWYEKVSLKDYLLLDGISSKRIRKMLSIIGKNYRKREEFMNYLIKEGDLLLYDGSVVFSFSNNNKLVSYGYNKEGLFLPKINIALLFSWKEYIPVYITVFEGSIHEVKTIRDVIDKIKEKKIIFIGDRAYSSNKIFYSFLRNNIDFIIPLKRNDYRVNYDINLNNVFKFNDKIILWNKYKVDKNLTVYIFEDKLLKYHEEKSYYSKIIEGKKVKYPKDYLGRIPLISSLNINGEEIYSMYRSRINIEKAFHIFQNLLEVDTPHISKEDIFNGYLFLSFISLIMYYKIIKFLKKRNLLKRYSCRDVLFELSKVQKKLGTNDLLPIPKRTEKLIKSLNYKIKDLANNKTSYQI